MVVVGSLDKSLTEQKKNHTHTYVVQLQDGVFYRRNRLHIRPTNIEVIVRDKWLARCDSRDQQNFVYRSRLAKAPLSQEQQMLLNRSLAIIQSYMTIAISIPLTIPNHSILVLHVNLMR